MKTPFLKIILLAIFLLILSAATLFFFRSKKTSTTPPAEKESLPQENPASDSAPKKPQKITLGDPEISGWIAWWIEEDGYAVLEKHSGKISGVSPGWFKLDKNKKLVEIGKIDKKSAAEKIRIENKKFHPMLVTDLSNRELFAFLKNEKQWNAFLDELIGKLKEYQSDGLDLDFENIDEKYSSDFSLLVENFSRKLRENDLKFSIAVQAQTGQNDWSGLKGQNLNLIGQQADEVRVMIYDRHGEFSAPGPIAPMDWYLKTIEYGLKQVPREKLVIGLPTYGYVWGEKENFQSFQFKDFASYAENKKFRVERDAESFELKYSDSNSTGWLSDSETVIEKINRARGLGINRFILWNLSGTDERIFEKQWEKMEITTPNRKK